MKEKSWFKAALEADGFIFGTSEYEREKRMRRKKCDPKFLEKERARSMRYYRDHKKECNERRLKNARKQSESKLKLQRERYQEKKETELKKIKKRRVENVHRGREIQSINYWNQQIAESHIGPDEHYRRIKRVIAVCDERYRQDD